MRQRSPGRWEVRVSVGVDPVSGASVSRSVSVHGELADAGRRQEELAAQAAALRATQKAPLRNVGDLLERWLDDEPDWKPGTWRGYRDTCRRLRPDPLMRRVPTTVTPPIPQAAMRAWAAAGTPTTTISLQVRTLRSAFDWAHQPASRSPASRSPGCAVRASPTPAVTSHLEWSGSCWLRPTAMLTPRRRR